MSARICTEEPERAQRARKWFRKRLKQRAWNRGRWWVRYNTYWYSTCLQTETSKEMERMWTELYASGRPTLFQKPQHGNIEILDPWIDRTEPLGPGPGGSGPGADVSIPQACASGQLQSQETPQVCIHWEWLVRFVLKAHDFSAKIDGPTWVILPGRRTLARFERDLRGSRPGFRTYLPIYFQR